MSYLDDKYGDSTQPRFGQSTGQANVATPKPLFGAYRSEIAYGVVIVLLLSVLAVGITLLVLNLKKAAQSSRHDS